MTQYEAGMHRCPVHSSFSYPKSSFFSRMYCTERRKKHSPRTQKLSKNESRFSRLSKHGDSVLVLRPMESGQLSRCHQQHRQGVSDVLRRAAVGDEQIVDGVEGDGRPQQPARAGHLQPRPPPCVGKPAAHDQTAEDVHGSRAEAAEEDEGEAVRAVLNEIADVFKGGKAQGERDGGGLDFIPLRLKHQKIEHQRQQLHHFLHHRRDFRRGGKGIRLTYRREEGVDIGREQAHPHSGNAEQEEAELPPAHAQSGHQQRGHHAEKDVFDVGHASTAFLVAGSSPRIASVSSISHQKVGLVGEVSGQKQPAVQSRYSETTKHSTPMWKYRIFCAAPVCVFA